MPLVATVSNLGCAMAACSLRLTITSVRGKNTPHPKWMLLRGKADVREIGSHHGASRKSAVLNDLPVFRFRQSPPGIFQMPWRSAPSIGCVSTRYLAPTRFAIAPRWEAEGYR